MRLDLARASGFLSLAVVLQSPSQCGSNQGVVIYSVVGEDEHSLGRSVASLGDVDGDGVADFAAGGPGTTDGPPVLGLVRVYSGANGSLLRSIVPAVPGYFGFSIGGTGDVDKDGVPDLVVGAPTSSVNCSLCGSAYVYSGQDGSVLFTWHGDSASDYLGSSVDGAGDVDADGWPDVVVGAPYDEGAAGNGGSVTVFSGRTGAVVYRWFGGVTTAQLGTRVAGAGDVDDDGYADVIAGARLDNAGTRAGSATVFSGRDGSVLHKKFGDVAKAEFGTAVDGAGDVNADGFDDFLVGAHQRSGALPRNGAAYVYSGKTGVLLYRFLGDTQGARLGFSVSGAGDVDSDGHADFLVGSQVIGAVQLHSGKDGSLILTATAHGPGGGFGEAVSDLGDVDADGVLDFLVGAPDHAEAGELQSGQVTVFSGRPFFTW